MLQEADELDGERRAIQRTRKRETIVRRLATSPGGACPALHMVAAAPVHPVTR